MTSMAVQTKKTDAVRYPSIFDRMMTLLRDRDGRKVSIIDLLDLDEGPHPREVIGALRWAADEYGQQVDTLRRMASAEKGHVVLPEFAKAAAAQLAAAERRHAVATTLLDMVKDYAKGVA
jgi:hypothetical protein